MVESDLERDIHLLELGRAITEWAKVEAELFHIVVTVLGCRARQAAVVFYRTPTLEQRVQLTNDLLATIFPQPSDNPGTHPHPGFTVWSDLQKEFRAENAHPKQTGASAGGTRSGCLEARRHWRNYNRAFAHWDRERLRRGFEKGEK